jgi:hypothetical protein
MARIGIIGTGWGARVQVPAFREAGLDVVAIAGSHRNKTRRVAGELATAMASLTQRTLSKVKPSAMTARQPSVPKEIVIERIVFAGEAGRASRADPEKRRDLALAHAVEIGRDLNLTL